jgi:RNA ligase
VRSVHRGALFLRLDGKDYRPGLWQLVRPAGDVTPTGNQVSEE